MEIYLRSLKGGFFAVSGLHQDHADDQDVQGDPLSVGQVPLQHDLGKHCRGQDFQLIGDLKLSGTQIADCQVE